MAEHGAIDRGASYGRPPTVKRGMVVSSRDCRWALACMLACLAGCDSDGAPADGGCITSRHCAADQVCVAGHCQAVPRAGCAGEDACDIGEYCDPVEKICKTVEVVDCEDDTVCPAGQRCNTLTGVCVPGERPCMNPEDCPAPTECVNGSCVDPTRPPPDPDPCAGDAECAPPLTICEQTACVPGCGQPGGASCTGGDVCDSTTGRCVPDPNACGADAQCSPPQTVCEGGQCTPGCGAVGGLACTGATVCDTNTGRCVPIAGPCTSDAQCNPPQTVCEGGQCVPGCGNVGGIQCTGNSTCNVASGRCEAGPPVCGSDRDCNPPQTICDTASGQCSPGCGATGCSAPQTCDATTGHCGNGPGPGTCGQDNFEPNDSASAAAALPMGAHLGLEVCDTDQDYFVVNAAAGELIEVSNIFRLLEGDVDMELQDASGSVLAGTSGGLLGKTISYVAQSPGPFVLRVWLALDLGSTDGNRYGLSVSTGAAPMCSEDTRRTFLGAGNAVRIKTALQVASF